MEPTSFPESNDVLGPPKGMTEDECCSLSIHRHTGDGDPVNPYPMVISCWKLTAKELEEINQTKRLYLWVFGRTMPPVILSVASPFHSDQIVIPTPEPDYKAKAIVYEKLLESLLPGIEEVKGAGGRIVLEEGVDGADSIRAALAKYKNVQAC